ncbi:hypothetical protein jhhlp_003039 [Lomentospora prolificans]|uniref:Uncharacterized protein n=1 Tax=Lomentospora prolificans TaxID=41688 RepID=A0A2N3NFV3_9PEZI|nr:hypothetical protein jhhlp_003039 [Lomentospora prolificans]
MSAPAALQSLNAPEKPLSDIVQALNSQILANESKAGDIVWDSWNTLFSIAGKTPGDQQGRLVEFVELLRKSPIKNAAGQDILVEHEALWRALPTFGWVARDLWNWNIHDPNATAEDFQDWDNKTAFLARLTSRSDPNDGRNLDASMYALWAMRSAFEQDCPENVSNAPAIRNAAIWIIYAGKALRRSVSNQVDMPDRCGVPGSKLSEKEWRGFNAERWSLWKKGFEEAADSVVEANVAAQIMEDLQ